MRASSTGLPFLLPAEAGLVSPPAGVSLWFLSPGAEDAQKGLPSAVQLLFCCCCCLCCCSAQGWGPGAFPGDGLGALKLVFIPPTDRLSATLLCCPFLLGLLDSSSQQMKVTGRGLLEGRGVPVKGRSQGCLLESWPSQPAGWRWFSCILGASLFRLCVFHTHTYPFTAALTHPSFMVPLVFPACQCPHPLQPLFLLLPCLALALTLGITHSLCGHNSPSELAREHTHSYCSGT